MIRAGHDMRHVTVKLMREDLPLASLILAELEAFAPDERPLFESELPEIPGKSFRARISRANAASADENWVAIRLTALATSVDRSYWAVRTVTSCPWAASALLSRST